MTAAKLLTPHISHKYVKVESAFTLRPCSRAQADVETGRSVHHVGPTPPIDCLAWNPRHYLLAYAGDDEGARSAMPGQRGGSGSAWLARVGVSPSGFSYSGSSAACFDSGKCSCLSVPPLQKLVKGTLCS